VGIPNPKIIVEFRDFLLKTNMFALAMAVVIGAAVGDLVKALVADLVMPVIAVILPKDAHWQNWTLDIWKLRFPLGHLFWQILNFVIIAAVVFMMTKLMLKFSPPAPPAPAATKVCPQCLEAVHVDAKKCKYCTSAM
jgi:large conductance mechanosensitive channel